MSSLSARFGDFNKPEVTTWTNKERALSHKRYWLGITRQGTRRPHQMPRMKVPFKMFLRYRPSDDSWGVWVQEVAP